MNYIKLPCNVGDSYFRIELFCDENGYLEEPTHHWGSDCYYCCEPCNGFLKVSEHKFNSIIDILRLQEYFGKSVFLTREEAEAKLKELKESEEK